MPSSFDGAGVAARPLVGPHLLSRNPGMGDCPFWGFGGHGEMTRIRYPIVPPPRSEEPPQRSRTGLRMRPEQDRHRLSAQETRAGGGRRTQPVQAARRRQGGEQALAGIVRKVCVCVCALGLRGRDECVSLAGALLIGVARARSADPPVRVPLW